MVDAAIGPKLDHDKIHAALRQYWGFESLRPWQEQAIHAGLEQRDSLVVLPTGGGKSLCYQLPPLLAERTDVVVSPLISLMKDQVDGLRQCGYPAVALHSGVPMGAAREMEESVASGDCRLVFVAPERLFTAGFQQLLKRIDVRAFAIDEAHCVSHWGHDFRPEYRQLAALRKTFPKAGLNAYTATATPRVRDDIVTQLGLRDPSILIGSFDRANLIFRVVQRIDPYGQVLEVVRRHPEQAVIVYCISRRDTEEMASFLKDNKIKAAAYHAGMSPQDRRRAQDDFAEERLDVVVATVAFGMGIDRSDVRCVIHAAMPKSVEHYQQEAGRAGRDGLEAECVMLYSPGDIWRWESLIDKSAENAQSPIDVSRAGRELLRHMQNYCNAALCRHRQLVEYFGQQYENTACGACDVCLDETESLADGTTVAKKILSCVARVEERFGAGHVVDVLLGANTEMVRQCRHEQLSTHGLMKEMDKKALTNLVHQLVGQGVLERTPGDRPILKLNDASWRVMRGQQDVKLLRPRAGGVKRTAIDAESWDGVDRGLFEDLRTLRHEIALRDGVAAFIVFGDATLRELARVRPSGLQQFAAIRGVGKQKLAQLGEAFVKRIGAYCRSHDLLQDQSSSPPDPEPTVARITASQRSAFDLFAKGESLDSVMATLGRARSTTSGYLAEYILTQRPATIDRWIEPETYKLIANTAAKLGPTPMKPIFEALGGKVPYDQIRLVTAHLAALDLQVGSAHSREA